MAGYTPGQGRTFTPSLTAKWTDEFNELLNKSGVSRNALTEELIEIGLKFKKNEHLLISTSTLTPEQIELLSSPQGQTILLNVALMLLGNPLGLSKLNFVNESSIKETAAAKQTNSVVAQPKEQKEVEELSKEPNFVDEPEDLIQTLPDRLISTQSQGADEKKLTPIEKARLKMRALNQSKGDLRA